MVILTASSASASTGLDLVVGNILQQYPGRMPFSAAAKIAGFHTLSGAHTARARGTFPIRTQQEGSRLIVYTADAIEYLRSRKSQASQSAPPIRKIFKVRTGRPTKREALEADRLGLTVRELRAQSSIHGLEDGILARNAKKQQSQPNK